MYCRKVFKSGGADSNNVLFFCHRKYQILGIFKKRKDKRKSNFINILKIELIHIFLTNCLFLQPDKSNLVLV